mmetsp:Transcript_149289/g.274238  ORF Transcript_149289/g.274238 Transcript_149289/m.274238 type:complete len:86 (-) Transcript_149289:100-357(-)
MLKSSQVIVIMKQKLMNASATKWKKRIFKHACLVASVQACLCSKVFFAQVSGRPAKKHSRNMATTVGRWFDKPLAFLWLDSYLSS